jgi:hypothetical protein
MVNLGGSLRRDVDFPLRKKIFKRIFLDFS